MSDFLFQMPDSPAPQLESARRDLEQCEKELRKAHALLETQGPEAQPYYDKCYFAHRSATRIVENLEKHLIQ